MHLIELNNICKSFTLPTGRVDVLQGIDLSVDTGEFVAIIGQSGSGKSTLMNILGCLDTPTKGKYILNGSNVSAIKKKSLTAIRSKEIGFIFQSFNLISSLTALENVELPLSYKNIPKLKRRKAAKNALKKVGLENRMNHKPSQLSGGQQQRVAIARAIAASPPIILADEPTGNLDSKSGKEIIEILLELHRKGKTLILITHDNALADLADRKIAISDGRIL